VAGPRRRDAAGSRLRSGRAGIVAMQLKASEWGVLVFTLAYVAGFAAWFLAIGNYEFLWYIATLLFFVVLIAATIGRTRFPAFVLWALSIWGLAHMAGGGIRIDGAVLYALKLIPITGEGELTVLKYDQLVHFYGFGVTALVLWHLLRNNFPALHGTATIYCFAALGSMGLGCLNELIEFAAVLALPDTNVGGYYNTALDLFFNSAGAVTAMILVRLGPGRRPAAAA
jgi:putative membrane protein